jgi:hypothetical protein
MAIFLAWDLVLECAFTVDLNEDYSNIYDRRLYL